MAVGRLRRRLLRFGFRLLYNEFAWAYDLIAWSVSTGLWWTWQRAAIPHLRGARVLEVAFGTGRLLPELYAAGLNPMGVDLSQHMIEITRRRLRGRGLPAPVCRASVEALPFASGSFDSLIATFPTPFIGNPEVLREFARVLGPGGRLVIVDRAVVTHPRWAANAIDWLYGATDQAPNQLDSPVRWLTSAGWRATETAEPHPRSTVHLVIAETPTQAGDSPGSAFRL